MKHLSLNRHPCSIAADSKTARKVEWWNPGSRYNLSSSYPSGLLLFPIRSMRSLIRSVVAFLAIALAASWTTVLAQQAIDAEQIAISAASNVCLLFCCLSLTDYKIFRSPPAKSLMGNIQTPAVPWCQGSPAEKLDDRSHVVWTERLQGIPG